MASSSLEMTYWKTVRASLNSSSLASLRLRSTQNSAIICEEVARAAAFVPLLPWEYIPAQKVMDCTRRRPLSIQPA